MNEGRIEFRNGEKLVGHVESAMVPPVGSYISIRKTTYEVVRVTYALDHADDSRQRAMRANVDLIKVPV